MNAPAMETYTVEVTDTFGGEANYSWVNRYTIQVPAHATPRTTMRRAKAAAGYTGVRGRTYDFGDTLEFRPYRECVVMFVTWREAGDQDFAQGSVVSQILDFWRYTVMENNRGTVDVFKWNIASGPVHTALTFDAAVMWVRLQD